MIPLATALRIARHQLEREMRGAFDAAERYSIARRWLLLDMTIFAPGVPWVVPVNAEGDVVLRVQP